MKVKIFVNGDYEILEKAINNWLKENNDYKIEFVTQSEDAKFWTITIWYTIE